MNEKVVDSQPFRKQTPPTAYQEFPKTLFHPTGASCTVNTKEQEDVMLSRGYYDGPPPVKASAEIDIRNHPQTVAEGKAMAEQAQKFDQAYAALYSKWEALQAENEELREKVRSLEAQPASVAKGKKHEVHTTSEATA